MNCFVASGITTSSGRSRKKIRHDAQLPKENSLAGLVPHVSGSSKHVRGETVMEAKHSHTHSFFTSQSSLHRSFQHASTAAIINITDTLGKRTALRQTAKTRKT